MTRSRPLAARARCGRRQPARRSALGSTTTGGGLPARGVSTRGGGGIVSTINVEIIAPLISGAKHCQHCQDFLDDAGISQRIQEEELKSYPEEMWRDYARLSQVVRDLSQR